MKFAAELVIDDCVRVVLWKVRGDGVKAVALMAEDDSKDDIRVSIECCVEVLKELHPGTPIGVLLVDGSVEYPDALSLSEALEATRLKSIH